jgi:hypothetical protein
MNFKRERRRYKLVEGVKNVLFLATGMVIPSQAIEACIKSAGADVIYSATECYV